MPARTTNAATDFVDALAECGRKARVAEDVSGGAPVVLVPAGRGVLPVAIVTAAAPSPTAAASLVDTTEAVRYQRTTAVPVLVADRISEAARRVLRDAGWGWLDRRGHLHLDDPRDRLFLRTEVPRINRKLERASAPLETTVGLEVALELLMQPESTPGVRELARRLGRAPSSVSVALKGLRQEGLADRDNRPHSQALFEAVSANWVPTAVPLATRPDAELVDEIPRLQAHLTQLEAPANGDDPRGVPGWALTDTLGAAAWGAPVAVSAGYPPDLYVPDERVAARAVERFGRASTHGTREALVLVAPAAPAVRNRFPVQPEFFGGDPWPLAHPVVVALDLARDPGRGQEILESWSPEGFTRVW